MSTHHHHTAGPLPTLFLSHGSPMIALEPGAAGLFMQRLGPVIDAIWGRPRGIVIMSPHTTTRTPFVLGAPRHEAIHDFGGFPPELYEVAYDVAGEPGLAREVAQLLGAHNATTRWIEQSGVDHGVWTALMHLYPQAQVPAVPVSLMPQLSPAEMMAMGRALQRLRHEGVLVIGSGSLTHNLQRFFTRPVPVDAPVEADCMAFCDWVAQRAQADDWPALLGYRAQAPFAREMHPTDEHWLPFYFAAGAAGAAAELAQLPEATLRLHASVTHGHLAMDAYAFGEPDQLANLAKALSN